jgi:hypothetical protein
MVFLNSKRALSLELFNGSKTAREAGLEYPVRSLSSRRFDRIMGEIVKLILIAKKIQRTVKKRQGDKEHEHFQANPKGQDGAV